jgi:hypothetical protein
MSTYKYTFIEIGGFGFRCIAGERYAANWQPPPDYRIIHSVGTAYTHKSKPGSYQAFMIDIGSYAFLRKLHGKLVEVDLFDSTAKEKIRAG